MYGLVQDLEHSGSFGMFHPEEFWMFVQYYEEGKGFYWKSKRCSGSKDCIEKKNIEYTIVFYHLIETLMILF